VRHPVAPTVVLSSLLLVWCVCACALDPSLDLSQYAHSSWKVRDGFAKAGIFLIAQTPDGYLWLGTESGLLRFDGVRAVPWQPPGGEQLPSNYISGLLVAQDGTLWIGTLNGLASYKEGKLTRYSELAGVNIGLLLEDRQQTIWFGTRQAATGRLCAIRNGYIKCYGAGSFGIFVNALYEDHKGNLWLNSAAGLWRWAPGPPERYALPPGISATNALVEDDSGTVLLGTTDGLKRLVAGRFENYKLPGISGHFTAFTFLHSPDGTLWIGTSQGLLRLHHGRVDRLSLADGLSGDVVQGIIEDREGTVWAATTDGLDRFREYAVPTITRDQGLPNSNAALVQATSDGSIWIGTANGLSRWGNGRLSFYRGRSALSENRAPQETELSAGGPTTEVANSGLIGAPRSLGLDDEGRLWVSTGEGVFYFERGRFFHVSGITSGYIFCIAGDGHGGVWILDVQNLFHWFPHASVQEISWSQFGQKTGRAMLPDRESGGLWLGFYEGDVVYVKDGKVIRSYGPGIGLGDGRINHLRFGPKGGVWASTERGLSRIKDERIATMTQNNGLPCDEVHWSLEDDDHAIWLYMPCGLVRIARSELDGWINDPKHVLKTTVFDNSDGVRSVGVYGSAGPHVTKSPDGRIWFAPRDGVSVIDPRHLPFNKVPPPVHVEQIAADGKTYNASNGLSLPARVRDLTIDYTALSLVVPEKIHFRYKLEGQDPDWREVVNDRRVQYSNLAPRHYTFRVMACNNSGVWNEAGTSIDFSVLPAFYQTNLFRALCVFGVLALLWGTYQLRVQQLQSQFNIGLEARVNERTRIARELHDTLLQTLHGLMFQFQAVRNLMPRRPEEAMKSLDDAINETEKAISESRDAIHGLRSEPIAKGNLAELLMATSQELLRSETSNHQPPAFELIEEGERRTLSPTIKNDVCRIAREILRNAYRHARAHRIETEVRYGDNTLRIRVRDDGKGIDPSVLKEGGIAGHWGLRGIRERAERIGGQLEFWSEHGAGTEVQLSVPASVAYEVSPESVGSKLLRKLGKHEQHS